jgi:hypothetical protein
MRSAICDAVAVRDPLDEMNDVAPELWLLDPHERLCERKSVRSGKEVSHVARRRRRALSDWRSRRRRRAFEEERYWHLQDLRDVMEAARADPICTLLVFLYLLECQAKGIPELRLAHAEHHPAHAHTSAHVLVSRVGDLLRHSRLIARFCGYQRVRRRDGNGKCGFPIERVVGWGWLQ